MMPTDWELPSEMFELNLAKSENPTVNLCDAIVRKVNLLNENFRGNRKPDYMRPLYKSPSVISKENAPSQTSKLPLNFAMGRSASVP